MSKRNHDDCERYSFNPFGGEGAPVDKRPFDFKPMTDDEADQIILAGHCKRHPGVVLNLAPTEGLMLVASLQLALRHPSYPDHSRETLTKIKDVLLESLATMPSKLANVAPRRVDKIVEILNRGDDPNKDVDVEDCQ